MRVRVQALLNILFSWDRGFKYFYYNINYPHLHYHQLFRHHLNHHHVYRIIFHLQITVILIIINSCSLLSQCSFLHRLNHNVILILLIVRNVSLTWMVGQYLRRSPYKSFDFRIVWVLRSNTATPTTTTTISAVIGFRWRMKRSFICHECW